MKTVNTIRALFIAILLLVPAWSFAKSQVKASTIIDQINAGKAARYKNAEIVGNLDFTSIKDVTDEALFKYTKFSTDVSFS
jgi:hypothetical protein